MDLPSSLENEIHILSEWLIIFLASNAHFFNSDIQFFVS